MNKTAKKPVNDPTQVPLKIDARDAREFHAAGARVNETAEAAKMAMAAHDDARAVFAYVSARISREYKLAPGSQIAPDGTVTSPAPDASAQA